jgi:hypothetical protein
VNVGSDEELPVDALVGGIGVLKSMPGCGFGTRSDMEEELSRDGVVAGWLMSQNPLGLGVFAACWLPSYGSEAAVCGSGAVPGALLD